jgi:hypothetical protein
VGVLARKLATCASASHFELQTDERPADSRPLVYYAGGKGLCLLPAKDALSASVEAHVFDTDFKPVSKARVAGLVSRGRMSPDGRYGAATTFVTGHSSLGTGGASTQRCPAPGRYTSSRAMCGRGVPGSYTRASSAPRSRPTRLESPTKKRQGREWRLHVLDLATGRETALAETRSVDDQVEWLDNALILYGLQRDVWAVRADGRGRPRIYIRDALSPAVVRA